MDIARAQPVPSDARRPRLRRQALAISLLITIVVSWTTPREASAGVKKAIKTAWNKLTKPAAPKPVAPINAPAARAVRPTAVSPKAAAVTSRMPALSPGVGAAPMRARPDTPTNAVRAQAIPSGLVAKSQYSATPSAPPMTVRPALNLVSGRPQAGAKGPLSAPPPRQPQPAPPAFPPTPPPAVPPRQKPLSQQKAVAAPPTRQLKRDHFQIPAAPNAAPVATAVSAPKPGARQYDHVPPLPAGPKQFFTKETNGVVTGYRPHMVGRADHPDALLQNMASTARRKGPAPTPQQNMARLQDRFKQLNAVTAKQNELYGR